MHELSASLADVGLPDPEFRRESVDVSMARGRVATRPMPPCLLRSGAAMSGKAV
jgi:hypothetical protein